MKPRQSTRWILALIVAMLVAAHSFAGVGDPVRVILKSGEKIEGTLLDENSQEIVIETLLHNIRYKKTVQVRQIKEIEVLEEKINLPSKTTPSNTAPAKPDTPFTAPARYMLLPIHGNIGIDSVDDSVENATSPGIDAALRFARRRGIKHIVFSIDSRAGSPREAMEIVDVMERYDDAMEFHAFITYSSGPSVFLVFACDSIWFGSGAFLGDAQLAASSNSVADSPGAPTPAAWARELQTLAESKGHSGFIAAAMADPSREVYLWTDTQGGTIVGAAPPEDGTNAARLGSGESALVLSAPDAFDAKLASALSVPSGEQRSHSQIGRTLRIEKWNIFGRYGEKQIAITNRALVKAENDRHARAEAALLGLKIAAIAASPISSSVSDAERLDPNLKYYSRQRGGLFTTAARRTWVRNTDACLQAWRRVLSQIDDIVQKRNVAVAMIEKGKREATFWSFRERFESDREELEQAIESLEVHGPQLNVWKAQADDEIARLRRARGRDG